MPRVSQILADSLSNREYGLMQDIRLPPVGCAAFDPLVLETLRDLRLIEFSLGSIVPRLSELGVSVLFDRFNSPSK